ncbi:MAG: rRNA pseudouridine synthase [Clostridia bacterium]|nr:rRNA pseudouridine synthase [Clostridia bacterium]
MRLQKFIAECGIASRRNAEKMIESGRVRVNGELVDYMGCIIDPECDTVEVDGRVIKTESKKYYIMLHKPKNHVTTVSDDLGRPTVMHLVQDINARIYPVGRLDFDTSGLLIMTNDGNFANILTHPKHVVNKTYIARVDRPLSEDEIEKLQKGIDLDGVKTAPAKVENIKRPQKGYEVKITIHEGRNRQVRRMLDAVGANVMSLKRISVGSLTLGNLPEGKWRRLSDAEINKLRGKSK